MSKPRQTITYAIGLIITAGAIGIGGTFFYVKPAQSWLRSDGSTFRQSLQLITHQVAISQEGTTTPLEPDEMAALNELIDDIVAAEKDQQKVAHGRVQILFAAADEDPNSFGDHAEFVARQLIARAQDTSTHEFAQSYLILAKFRDGNADDWLLEEMAKFACEYTSSEGPIQLYQQLADRLVNDGRSEAALRLLEHGIENCASCRSVKKLKQHKSMTQQTISLLGRFASRSRSSRSRASRKMKETRTREGSKHYRFIGKSVNLMGPTLQGSSVTRQDLQGEWVYVHFWATWCGACRSAVPSLVRLEKKYSQIGVKFVGVNMDTDQQAAQQFVKSKGITWPQIASKSSRGWDAPLAEEHGVKSIPVSFLVAPNGEVVEADQTGRLGNSISYHVGG